MIRLAVIGAGHWGPNLIRNFYDSRASFVRCVVDRDRGRLAQIQSRFPTVTTDVDPQRAIDDPEVDAVVIATPTVTHYELVKRALLAGKHVLVEKPIASSSAQAIELCELAERMGRVLMVGHVFLYNGGTREVKRYLNEGELGSPYYISMVRTNLGPIRMDVNAAWDLASHDISMASYWLDAEPVSVTATGGVWINTGLADAVFATLRYPNEVLVNLHASWLNPRKAREITVVGDRRMLTFDDMNLLEPIRIYDKQVSEALTTPSYVDTFATFRASVRDGVILIPKVGLGEPLKNECEEFLACIEQGRTPIANAKHGLSVVRVLEAMDRSMRNAGREEAIA